MVLAAGVRGLESCSAIADVDPLHEPEIEQHLEYAVDARDSDRAPSVAELVEYLLGGEAALLRRELLDHGRSRAPGAIPGKA